MSESTKPEDQLYSNAHQNNMPKVSQMAASKNAEGNGLDSRRKNTGLSPEKNISLEEHKCGTTLPGSDDQMKKGKRLFPNRLKHQRSEKSMTEKKHETTLQNPQSGGSSSLLCNQAFQRNQAFQHSQKPTSKNAVSGRSDGTLRHSQRADFRHSSVGKSKLYSRRPNTEVKNIRNERNGHTSEGSFRIIDKFGTAICILSCVSDIENLDEMIEYKGCGLDDETLWYLTSKVKIKVREKINYIKSRD